MSAVRCYFCSRPCEREVEPAVGDEPAVFERDVWVVVLRNRLLADVCQACWQAWPDPWKRFPAVGFGRGSDEDHGPRRSTKTVTDMDEFVRLLRETAP